jgi:hypothetical protein
MDNKPQPYAVVRDLHLSLPVGRPAGLAAFARQRSGH